MSLLRDPKSFKTGVQEIEVLSDAIDMGYDFVMVYGFHRHVKERIHQFREKGYQVHFMTGISWGHYEDYLYGKFDGMNHWDEAQMDKDGNYILHGVDVPYMVPTLNYANYIISKLKEIVDCQVFHLHLEEPEFWQHAGYSKAFAQAYEIYYHQTYDPHLDTYDHIYKVAKLKAYLYTQAIQHISYAIKVYGKEVYDAFVYVYIPTHSLLNYTQWHLVSPESKLAHLREVDGFIGQVWAGTSKVQNTYLGVKKERTFETAFLEYGIVSGLNHGTHKAMWFLNDPIEDNPGLTWDQYAYDYQRTLVASLLHPKVNQYEICPWPTRVFSRKLPRVDENQPSDVEPTWIPDAYDVLLNNTFQMLGDMPLAEQKYHDVELKVGLCLSDTAMFQRKVPAQEASRSNHHRVSIEFPDYYGLALPVLKKGIPLLGVILEHAPHFESYLEQYDLIILSYEFMKPATPDIHYALKRYVESGKSIIYVGDDSDPFHQVDAWWNQTLKDQTPRRHLFETLGVKHHVSGIYPVGKGVCAYYQVAPYLLTENKLEASLYTQFFMKVLCSLSKPCQTKPWFRLTRGPYEIISYLDETDDLGALQIPGYYLDMLTPGFNLVKDPYKRPGEVGIYYDVSKANHMDVMGTTYRIQKIEKKTGQVTIEVYGKKHIHGYLVLKSVRKPSSIYKGETKLSFDYQVGAQVLKIALSLDQSTETIKIND